jgi:Flp pilus assembly protein CpaB
MRTRLATILDSIARLRRSHRGRTLITIALAIGAASVTIGSLASAAATRDLYGGRRPMPVAGHDLAVGQVIDASDIEWRTLPIALTAGSVASEPFGRTVIEPVVSGEILLDRRLSGSVGVGKAGAIPRTSRAVSLERNALTPPVEPGDEVDLFTASSKSQASVIARRAQILEVADHAVVVIVTESETAAVARAAIDAAVVIALCGQE